MTSPSVLEVSFWAWGKMVMCVQWISGSIREFRLVERQQIRHCLPNKAERGRGPVVWRSDPHCCDVHVTSHYSDNWTAHQLSAPSSAYPPHRRSLARRNLMLSLILASRSVAWVTVRQFHCGCQTKVEDWSRKQNVRLDANKSKLQVMSCHGEYMEAQR